LAGFPFLSALPVLGLFYLARGVATPLLRNYINLITTSEVRATVLSVRNLLIRLTFAITGPIFGWITDQYGLSSAMMSAGILFAILSGVSLIFFLRYKTYTA